MPDIHVRPLAGRELEAALDILVTVFAADPSFQRLIRIRSLIRPVLTSYYRRCLRQLLPESNADGAWDGDTLVGVALWYPPGQRPRGLMGRTERLFARRQRKARGGWLLEGIAVAEEGRGKGVGSSLLEHRLAGCTDAVHLQSTTEASARLYARFGFLADQGQSTGGLWMTRPPAEGQR